MGMMRKICENYFAKKSQTPPASDSRGPLNVLCFYIFGTLTFFNQEMLLSAAEDILSGQKLPTATVLVSFVTPLMITKIIAPWFIQRISYGFKTCFIAVSMFFGLAFVGMFNDIRAKLLGIALNAMATGAAEIIFLALTSFYPGLCISAFVAGTGMASLFSPVYYTGLTTWSCIAPKKAVLMTIPLPFLLVVFYALLDKDVIKNGSEQEIDYKRVDSMAESDGDEAFHSLKKSSCNKKLGIALKIFPFIIALCVSFFSEYLSMSSVVTTIAFPNSNIPLRDHFVYYSLSYGMGKFFGRSCLCLLAFLPSDALEFLKCSRTWVFSVLEATHLAFLLFESCYHFVPYMWMIILLCFTLGLLAGMIVVHSPHAVTRHVSPEEREFALGVLTVGNGVGSFFAGLIGLLVEPHLTNNCIQRFPDNQEFCFTRPGNSTGWENNFHCD